MKRSISINFHGLPIIAHGDYTEGSPETYINPSDPDEFNIDTIDIELTQDVWDSDSFLEHFHDDIQNLALDALDKES